MAKQTINIGAAPNDGTGTPLRTSFDYCNQNFTELYTATGPSGNNIVVPGSATITGDLTVRTNRLTTTTTGVGIGTAAPILPLDVRGTAGAGALFLKTTDPAAAVSSAYIQTPVSTGFSSLVPIYGFWYQNSGMGNPASDAISLITGSTERYRVDSAGTNTWSNVGGAGTAMTLNSTGLAVGTASATTKLDIQGFGDGELRIRAGSDAALIFSETVANKNWKIKPSAGTLSFQYSATAFNSGYANLMVVTETGNVGVGVTPNAAWNAGGGKTIQLTANASLTGGLTNSTYLAQNWYHDNTNSRYLVNGFCMVYEQNKSNGAHVWYNSINNTLGAGAVATLNPAMTLDASGNLLVGTVTPSSLIGGSGAITAKGIAGILSVNVTALSTNFTLPIGAFSGILVIRSNGGGGSAVWMLDPNAGAVSISNNIAGRTITFTFSGGAWQLQQTVGTVPSLYNYNLIATQ